jgi:predicted glycosyltransferase
MNIIIDILTPKQCMFLSRLIEHLERRGHQVSKTTRKYREVNQLLRLKGLEATTVGRHGGGTLAGKLRANAQRILELTRIIDELKPDMAVSFSSPEMARVAFGLGIPHICISDSPHAEAVSICPRSCSLPKSSPREPG